MKRTISIILAALMVVFMITACGGASSAAGKYYVKSIGGLSITDYFNAELEGTEGSEGFTVQDFLDIMGIPSLEEYMTMELKTDGSAIVAVGGEDPQTGTWTQSGDKVTITLDGDAAEFTLKGNEISAPMGQGSRPNCERLAVTRNVKQNDN